MIEFVLRFIHVMNNYFRYLQGIDALNRAIGYRVRPSWIGMYNHAWRVGLIFGIVNDSEILFNKEKLL